MAELRLSLTGIDADLSVRRVRIREAISRLFDIRLFFCSSAADLDLEQITRTTAIFSLSTPLGSRKWSGIIQQIKQTDVEPGGLSHYVCTMAPQVSILAANRDYRIFERRTAVDIINTILDDQFIHHDWRIDRATFPALEYRVQYGESDFHFVARLAEEAGVSFFFEYDEPRGSVLILADDPSRGVPQPGASLSYLHDITGAGLLPFATRVVLARKKPPPRIVRRDVDFRRPDFAHFSDGEVDPRDESENRQYEFAPGSSRILTEFPRPIDAPSSVPKVPGRNEPRVGKKIAERRGLAEAIQTRRVQLETNALDLAAGSICTISEHPHPWLGPDHPLLVTSFSLEAEHDKDWRAVCKAVFADQPYKPLWKTQRPLVSGLQPAIVQGPPGRDVAADEYGRIKVRFFWSRRAREESCWLRVVQDWAGPGYGLRTIPRVGQEVLVGFLEGNPDEPIVVGQLPNAKMPPPYPLPANQTKTVFRSKSTGGGDGHNELSFEDRQGEELLYLRAERDKETLVRGEERELIGGNRHELVGGHEHLMVKGNRFEEVRGDEHLAVGGNANAKVDGDLSLSVGGQLSLDIGGALSVRVEGKVVVVSLAKLLLAASDATMQSKGGFVRATPGTVYVSPIVENAGVSGGGTPNAPALPVPPVMPAAYAVHLPDGKVHLPVIGWVGGIPQVGSVPDEVLICRFICECKDAISPAGRREPQLCYIRKMRLYEQAARGVTHIWTEVPYDMSQDPPTPIMSRNEPWRQTGRKPEGSKIPDNVLVKDPSKPPTQDNIEKIIEIKFPGDKWGFGQREAYVEIAGSRDLVEVWGVDHPCYCDDQPNRTPEPVRVPALEPATLAIAALVLVLLLDDMAGGFADDAAIPPLVVELVRRLAPFFNPMIIKP